MKATIKTGGKQYNVCCGDVLDIEKLDAKAGDKVNLTAICVIDGDKIEADPAKASNTKVVAEVLEQHKGDKKIVFKFKRRKNYKVKNGHRQQLTLVRIIEIGSDKYSPKKADAKKADKPAAKKSAPKADKPAEKKPAPKAEKAADKPADKKEAPTAEAPKADKPAEKEAAPKDEAPKADKPAENADKPAEKPAETKEQPKEDK